MRATLNLFLQEILLWLDFILLIYLNIHLYFSKIFNIHLQSDRKGVCEATGEAFSLKKGKFDFEGEPNDSLGYYTESGLKNRVIMNEVSIGHKWS